MNNKKLGATSQYPKGKLNASDEGELRFAIGEEDGNIVLNFGTPVVWLALPPKMAVSLAQILIRKARVVAGRTGEVLEVKL